MHSLCYYKYIQNMTDFLRGYIKSCSVRCSQISIWMIVFSQSRPRNHNPKRRKFINVCIKPYSFCQTLSSIMVILIIVFLFPYRNMEWLVWCSRVWELILIKKIKMTFNICREFLCINGKIMILHGLSIFTIIFSYMQKSVKG